MAKVNYKLQKEKIKSKKVKIEFDKKQYDSLLRAMQAAGMIYGVMGDMVNEKYKKQSNEMDELENIVLQYAENFNREDIVEEYNGKKVFSEEYICEIMDDTEDYEEYSFWDKLVRKLAHKKMAEKYDKKEIEKMDHDEYMKELWGLEEEYWEMVEKHGMDKIVLKKD